MDLTASNIVTAISRLPKDKWFDYVNPKTPNRVKVVRIDGPEGPIVIQKFKSKSGKPQSISTAMIWRIANSFQPDYPINFERVLGSSYNTRSSLECLLAHTPEFYWCKPNRIEHANSTKKIKAGHKHIIWRPNHTHKNGILEKFETDVVISEITSTVVYDALEVSDKITKSDDGKPVDRRHLQIQVALVAIGHQLGFRTWIARPDQGFTYGDKKVGELDGIVVSLEKEKVMSAWAEAIKAAMYIDCIWFKNGRFMPAVMEVEHTTGIVTGLARMKRLQDHLGDIRTRWIIVAPDEDRHKVMKHASEAQYSSLNTKFLPYSAVDELFALCQKKRISQNSVNEQFLENFMEPCLPGLVPQ